jgi:release factor glutamine methyltransferase
MAALAGGVRSDAAARLAAAGCETPRLDAELLLAEALEVQREWLFMHSDAALPPDVAARFESLLERRVAREPVAYILGRRHFRHLELIVSPEVLIPRPETELLVEAALELPSDARVHDVGTGSGAVALAIKHERPDLEVSGSDISAAAVAVARANAHRLSLDVAFLEADGLPARDYSLVTANLPYVRADEWPSLSPEIRSYEPKAALVGGRDGLAAVRTLVAAVPAGMTLALEHAPSQGDAVRSMLSGAVTHSDLSGRERMTIGRARGGAAC